jgi:hypothetical protein
MSILNKFPPMDTIYGLHHRNIVQTLDTQNWSSKAVVRVDKKQATHWVYLWIRELKDDAHPQWVVRSGANHSAQRYDRKFDNPHAALHYINGQDALTPLAIETRLAHRSEWPPETPAMSLVCSL